MSVWAQRECAICSKLPKRKHLASFLLMKLMQLAVVGTYVTYSRIEISTSLISGFYLQVYFIYCHEDLCLSHPFQSLDGISIYQVSCKISSFHVFITPPPALYNTLLFSSFSFLFLVEI